MKNKKIETIRKAIKTLRECRNGDITYQELGKMFNLHFSILGKIDSEIEPMTYKIAVRILRGYNKNKSRIKALIKTNSYFNRKTKLSLILDKEVKENMKQFFKDFNISASYRKSFVSKWIKEGIALEKLNINL